MSGRTTDVSPYMLFKIMKTNDAAITGFFFSLILGVGVLVSSVVGIILEEIIKWIF